MAYTPRRVGGKLAAGKSWGRALGTCISTLGEGKPATSRQTQAWPSIFRGGVGGQALTEPEPGGESANDHIELALFRHWRRPRSVGIAPKLRT